MSSEQDAVERLKAALKGWHGGVATRSEQDGLLICDECGRQLGETTGDCWSCDDFHRRQLVEQALEAQRSRLARSQQENERLRHGITAIIEGDKGDEPLETADQVVSLLEGLLAALEEQEFKDSAS